LVLVAFTLSKARKKVYYLEIHTGREIAHLAGGSRGTLRQRDPERGRAA
jgi:hypothetical protein